MGVLTFGWGELVCTVFTAIVFYCRHQDPPEVRRKSSPMSRTPRRPARNTSTGSDPIPRPRRGGPTLTSSSITGTSNSTRPRRSSRITKVPSASSGIRRARCWRLSGISSSVRPPGCRLTAGSASGSRDRGRWGLGGASVLVRRPRVIQRRIRLSMRGSIENLICH